MFSLFLWWFIANCIIMKISLGHSMRGEHSRKTSRLCHLRNVFLRSTNLLASTAPDTVCLVKQQKAGYSLIVQGGFCFLGCCQLDIAVSIDGFYQHYCCVGVGFSNNLVASSQRLICGERWTVIETKLFVVNRVGCFESLIWFIDKSQSSWIFFGSTFSCPRTSEQFAGLERPRCRNNM